MQSVAVLLLDIAYKAGSTKAKNNRKIMLDLKKLMDWLRAMQHSDPVAARAYQVVRKIIKNSGPSFHDMTHVLLTEDAIVDSGVQPSSRNDSHGEKEFELRQGNAWPQEENVATPTAAPATFDFQYYQQPVDNAAPGFAAAQYFWPPQDQFHFPTTFGNPFVNPFDQGAPVVNTADLWADPGISTSMGDINLLGTGPAGMMPPTGPTNGAFFFQPPPGPPQ